MPEPKRHLKNYSVEALAQCFDAEGFESYRAEQVASWLYARGVEDPGAMTDLKLELRQKLASEWCGEVLEVERVLRSGDGTLKAQLRAEDGALLEAVVIPEEERSTVCVSTQVGCPLACSFCASGALGFRRNLTTAEIIDQVCRMRDLLPADRRITNVVFMGMGEPLLNLPAVLESIRILLHPKAFALGPRRITVSTAGVVPRIAELVHAVPVNLAVSLHATTDETRNRLVPLNRRFPLARLLRSLRELAPLTRRRPVFFEYTLIEGENDTVADARRLVGLLRGIPSKVNLIPVNAHPTTTHRPPAPQKIERFLAVLARSGLTVTLRRSRGAQIEAACGQLALREAARRSSSQRRV